MDKTGHGDSTTGIQEDAASAARATPPKTVEITINNKKVPITRGRHSVAELKRLGRVPECDELAEVKQGKLHPLPDDGFTHIEGGEQFLSSPRSCSSS